MTNTLIRPAWTPATIALMILGFWVFWPLGLAMLAYILWGDRLESFKSDINRTTDEVVDKFRGSFKSGREAYTGPYTGPNTGNVAFDDWREVELARLEAERRKLDEMRRDFDEYLRELRRAKDQDDFDAFRASRKRGPRTGKKSKSVPDT